MKNRFILTPYYLDENIPELNTLSKDGWLLNTPDLAAGARQARMGSLYQPLARMVAESIDQDQRPVSIAGDCCTAIGVLAGLRRAGVEPFLIWLDAHGDFNTWETTPSGFLGGMPLAMIAGRGEQTMLEAVGLSPLDERQILLTDARDLDPGEWESLENSAVYHLTDARALLEFNLPNRPLYVHFDTDILNPKDAMAMNYLSPGGPSAKDLGSVFKHLAHSGSVAAVSMSTWNPKLEGAHQSEEVCMGLLELLITG